MFPQTVNGVLLRGAHLDEFGVFCFRLFYFGLQRFDALPLYVLA